jgi:predicted unusual protein kinase regulating ubiquinone biosynthesis (AarF/ABC1/UbiB family)
MFPFNLITNVSQSFQNIKNNIHNINNIYTIINEINKLTEFLDEHKNIFGDTEIIVIPESDTGESDTGESDTGESDTGESDTGESDTGESDTGESDTGESDTGESDTGESDTGESDTGESDTGFNSLKKIPKQVLHQIHLLKSLILNSGCIYIKFSQWYVSNKLTAYPVIIKFFEDIFDQCPYHDDQITLNLLKEELNLDDEALNNYIDIESLKRIASGSIGQVYKCTLIEPVNNISDVIIKVKHPNLDKQINDFSYMMSWLSYIQSIHYFRNKLNLYLDFEDFMDNIYLQVDFNIEAKNGRKFKELYADSSSVYIPEIINSTKSILIAEFVETIEFDSLSEYQKSLNVLNFFGFIYDSLITTNFVHGDLHCKNWAIIENKDETTKHINKYKLVIFDYGICFSSESLNFNKKIWNCLEQANLYETIYLIKHSRGQCDLSEYIDKDIPIPKRQDIFEKINDIDNSIGGVLTEDLFISIKQCIKLEDVIICRFIMNIISVLFMIERYLIKYGFYSPNQYSNFNINHYHNTKIEVLSFCESKQTYPRLIPYLKKITEKVNYNPDKINSDDIEISLFNNLNSSKLVFKPIE